MSANRTPHVVATDSPDQRPSRVGVAQSRFAEAKAITDALVVRLSRERSELSGTRDGERVRVLRRVEVTRIALVDARAYEARVFAEWEHERSLLAGRPVLGVRGDVTARRVHQSVSTGSGASERLLRPAVRGSLTGDRRGA
ncbi:hypothetical protein ASF21_12765 [Arthrobacter sp. Leaf234]|nr:hypothetical protein ASF21_12765 [Arthrobacter sp. Leaf234]